MGRRKTLVINDNPKIAILGYFVANPELSLRQIESDSGISPVMIFHHARFVRIIVNLY